MSFTNENKTVISQLYDIKDIDKLDISTLEKIFSSYTFAAPEIKNQYLSSIIKNYNLIVTNEKYSDDIKHKIKSIWQPITFSISKEQLKSISTLPYDSKSNYQKIALWLYNNYDIFPYFSYPHLIYYWKKSVSSIENADIKLQIGKILNPEYF